MMIFSIEQTARVLKSLVSPALLLIFFSLHATPQKAATSWMVSPDCADGRARMPRATPHRIADHASVEVCKATIDRYFVERMSFFTENSKRTGDKIWGKTGATPSAQQITARTPCIAENESYANDLFWVNFVNTNAVRNNTCWDLNSYNPPASRSAKGAAPSAAGFDLNPSIYALFERRDMRDDANQLAVLMKP